MFQRGIQRAERELKVVSVVRYDRKLFAKWRLRAQMKEAEPNLVFAPMFDEQDVSPSARRHQRLPSSRWLLVKADFTHHRSILGPGNPIPDA